MILSILVLAIGCLLAFGGVYWFMQSAYNHKATQAIIAMVLVLVLTYGVPMLAVHVYYM